MSLLKSIAFLSLLVFSSSPLWAEERDCCTELRHEIQMIKTQLDNQKNTISQQETITKSSIQGVSKLIVLLSNQFPNLASSLTELKGIFDKLSK